MADIKISHLNEVASVSDADILPVVSDGTTKKVSVESLKNHITKGIEEKCFVLENGLNEQAIAIRQAMDKADGFIKEVDLTNTETYPFNNSRVTVPFNGAQERLNSNYIITVMSSSATNGFIEDVVFSDKMVNGFKVEYTGSATSAHLKLYIQGGK